MWSTKELSTFSAEIYLPWVLIDQRLEVVVLFVHSSHPTSKGKTTTRSGIRKRASSTAFVSPAILFPLLVDWKGFVKQTWEEDDGRESTVEKVLEIRRFLLSRRSTVEKSGAVRARRRRWPWIDDFEEDEEDKRRGEEDKVEREPLEKFETWERREDEGKGL